MTSIRSMGWWATTPHSWVLPRLQGKAKAAMVAIQLDEYGLGEQAVHSALEITSSLCSRPRIYA